MIIMKRFCLALDLINDETLINEYELHHKNVWPEVYQTIKQSGITSLEIYRVENRLFMIMEVEPGFSFEEKQKLDASEPKVAEWENLMWKYQQALPLAKPGEKWVVMEKIFSL
jgi:L-rhamnose mutarotase